MKEKNNPMYRLLITPEFRFVRHLLLLLSTALITGNNILLIYAGNRASINPYLVFGGYMAIYLFFIYLNIYVLIPRVLLRGEHVRYVNLLIVITALITALGISFQYVVHQYYNIPFGQHSFFSERAIPALEFTSDFLITGLLITGISVTVFFKYWLQNMEKQELLKKEKLNTTLDGLKERITPFFLLNVLHKAGELPVIKSGISSQLLLKLSRLLRYQLYDCGRDTVLLGSEIKFISDYLSLEHSCNEKLNYKIVYPSLEKNYLVPPLLFISFIEESLETLRRQEGYTRLDLKFDIAGGWLVFTRLDNRNESGGGGFLQRVSKRLELLDRNDYSLDSLRDGGNNKLIFRYRL